MPPPKITIEDAREHIKYVSEALADGYLLSSYPSAIVEGWQRYCRATGSNISRTTYTSRIERSGALYKIFPKSPPKKHKPTPPPPPRVDIEKVAKDVLFWLRKPRRSGPKVLSEIAARLRCDIKDIETAISHLRDLGVNIHQVGDGYDIPHTPPLGRLSQENVCITSRPDNTFLISGIGDLHAASKYCRWDVREDLIKCAESKGVQAIFDTGNWIDGEKPFNRYDLEVVGLEQQCQLLAERHPKTSIPIYAVAGDDHEGWYAQSEGIDVGRYAEGIMRDAGHNWTNIGYMESSVTLRNANTGHEATLAVVHPGGGSSYALSYSIQKIVESYEGGEKPNVALYGHYHKLWSGLIRNVFVAQTGTSQDQTPFMRKKRLEAHVGGLPWIELEQDPDTGAILSMTAPIRRYFNLGYYEGAGRNRWSHHGPVIKPHRSIKGIRK